MRTVFSVLRISIQRHHTKQNVRVPWAPSICFSLPLRARVNVLPERNPVQVSYKCESQLTRQRCTLCNPSPFVLLCNTPFAGRNLALTVRAFQSTSLGILRGTQARMSEHNEGTGRSESSSVKSNPNVDKLKQIMDSDPTDGWEKCWEQGLTPWDLGKPTPIILHLHQTGSLPKGRALVPGCGSGHDVVAIACPERFVVGLDISDSAIKKAKELSSLLPNANYFTFQKVDFFTWRPTEEFDLIFDYTFFCAIEPDLRSAWARRIQDILKPDGELITLMFPIDDHVGGPPYKVSIIDYEEVLHPMGFKAISIMDNELAIGPRKGREKLGRWKRSQPINNIKGRF